MANRIANLLGNTKTRTLVLLVAGILVFGVVIAVSQTESTHTKQTPERTSKTTEVPNQVKSTPGEQVSRKYRELQEQANVRGAEEAAKKGKTFIPTLTGNATGFDDNEFEKQLSSAYDDMGGKCSKETVAELRKQGMDNTKIIMELKGYGCSAAAIAALFSPEDIAAALLAAQGCAIGGCSPEDVKKLKDQGNDASKIAASLKANGCKVNDIATSLKSAGFDNNAIAVALNNSGSSATEIAVAMKASGATNAEIASALKASGANIEEIAAALKANGASATEVAQALSKAGYSKLEILPALSKAGFNSTDIAKAISSLDVGGVDPAALLAQQNAAEAAAQRLAAQQEAQQLAAFGQQRQAKLQELMAAMEAQKTAAIAVWNDVPQQSLVQGEWSTKNASDEAAGTVKAGGTTSSRRGGTAAAQEPKIILKAGSILFAVLDTAVNSDEPGPIMATIVSGSLKNSKLIGTMKTLTNSDTISLSFTAINMPNEAKSMGISAVAIDPDTARTALASDVDHHYLLRWGSLFASSFVEGFASAVANAGQTSTTSSGAAGTTTTTVSPGLDSKQQLFAGISAVGTKWSEIVGRNFDTPNTITIDQGTGIGVLVTSDLSYGSAPVFYSAQAASAPVTASTPLASAPGAAGAANNTNLSTDQAAALLSAITKQQQAAVTTTTNTGAGTNTGSPK